MDAEYDQVVEEVYLTAINDRGIYQRCFDLLKWEIETGGKLKPYDICAPLMTAARAAGINALSITIEQHMAAWVRIKMDLTEPVLRELGLDIADALKNGQRLLDEAQEKYEKQIQQTKEVNLMNELQNTPVKTITYIYGQDVDKLSKEQLIEAIKRSKKAISDLESVGVKSKHITGQIEDLSDAIDLMVAKLDQDAA